MGKAGVQTVWKVGFRMWMQGYVITELFVVALPVVENSLKNADEKSHFVYVEVGDRPTYVHKN